MPKKRKGDHIARLHLVILQIIGENWNKVGRLFFMSRQILISEQKTISRIERDIASNKLKKSVTAIHCKPSNKVTFVQWKLMNVCLYHAYSNLTKISRHRVHIDALNTYFAYSGNNWKLFNEAFKGLQTILFTWNAFGELIEANEKEPWIRVPFLSEVIWDSPAREFIYAFGRGIPEQFHIPKYYASFLLEMQNKFSSAFSLRIYEIGMRYIDAPKGSRKYGIDDLKELLAVQKNEYKNFKYFNRALKRAVKEINDISDINMSVEYIKERRKIVAIKFYILRNSDLKIINGTYKGNESDIMQTKLKLRQVMLEEFAWKPVESIDEFLAKYSLEQISEAIEYVRYTDFYKGYKNGNIQGNLGAYLRKAIISAYQSKKLEEEKKQRARRKLEELRGVAERITNLYKDHCKTIINGALDKILEQEKDIDLHDIFESESPFVVQESAEFARTMALGRKPAYYRSTGLYKSKFRSYLIEKYQLWQKLSDFDVFIEQLNNDKIRQDWIKVVTEIENGNLFIEIPAKLTMPL